jgi:DNA-binding NtrC family response regulator
VKPSQSHPHRTHSVCSPEGSAFPFVAKISEPVRTLLVVDDDPMVRELETQILGLEGYTVLQAESAAEALQVADQTPAIHLLITDFMMPELDGLELTRRFRSVHPETPVLMVSGSLPVLHPKSEPGLRRFDFLAKPFQFNEFIRKVRALLDAATPLPIRKPWCCD